MRAVLSSAPLYKCFAPLNTRCFVGGVPPQTALRGGDTTGGGRRKKTWGECGSLRDAERRSVERRVAKPHRAGSKRRGAGGDIVRASTLQSSRGRRSKSGSSAASAANVCLNSCERALLDVPLRLSRSQWYSVGHTRGSFYFLTGKLSVERQWR